MLASKVRYTRGDVVHGYCVFVKNRHFRILYIVTVAALLSDSLSQPHPFASTLYYRPLATKTGIADLSCALQVSLHINMT